MTVHRMKCFNCGFTHETHNGIIQRIILRHAQELYIFYCKFCFKRICSRMEEENMLSKLSDIVEGAKK